MSTSASTKTIPEQLSVELLEQKNRAVMNQIKYTIVAAIVQFALALGDVCRTQVSLLCNDPCNLTHILHRHIIDS